jgi:cell division septation protein DedD
VAAAGASVSLAVAGGMALRSPSDAEGAGPVEVAAAAEITEPQRMDAVAPNTTGTMPVATSGSSAARYAVLTASFPKTDVLRKGSAAATRFEAVVGELRGLGYEVRSMDVSLPERGEWRRVLVGEFATLSDAKAEAHRVHQTPTFADAQVVSY